LYEKIGDLLIAASENGEKTLILFKALEMYCDHPEIHFDRLYDLFKKLVHNDRVSIREKDDSNNNILHKIITLFSNNVNAVPLITLFLNEEGYKDMYKETNTSGQTPLELAQSIKKKKSAISTIIWLLRDNAPKLSWS